MNYIWRYNLAKTYQEELQTVIGSSSAVTSDYIEAHDDATSIYVSWSGSDLNDGSSASPVRTIEQALSMLDTTIYIITIQDSNVYVSDIGVTHYIDLDGYVLQGEAGQSPTIEVDTATQDYVAKISNGGKIINCEISIVDSGNQITGVEITNGTVMNTAIIGATRNGINVPAGSTAVNITNSIVKDGLNRGTTDGNAIKILQGTVTITRCLLVDNQRAGVYCSGALARTITLDYNTIAGNQYGVYGYGATNAGITVTDSIIYENSIYDYYHTGVTSSDSNIGSISGLSSFTRYVFNPIFVGNSDYRIRSIENGYGDETYTSQAIGVSSDGKDIGCYDYVRTILSNSYSEFQTQVPPRFAQKTTYVDGRVEYTNTLIARLTGKGYLDTVNVGWDDFDEDEFDSVKAMFETDGNIYLSTDDGETYVEYLIDKTRGLDYSKKVNKDNGFVANVALTLIEV